MGSFDAFLVSVQTMELLLLDWLLLLLIEER
jgi:hypothetical protein